jgi:hypothetical protein
VYYTNWVTTFWGKILSLSASTLKVEIVSFFHFIEITQYTGLHGVRTEDRCNFTAMKICGRVDGR